MLSEYFAVRTQVCVQQEHEGQHRSEGYEARRDTFPFVAEGERTHVAMSEATSSSRPPRPPGSGIFGPEIPSVEG